MEQLQSLILSGKLPAGSRLPSERAMMSEFNVSRPTVREALRVAESMGLISVRPGDPAGPKVLGTPSVGLSRLFDSLVQAGSAGGPHLLEVRIALDSAAAALAATQPPERLEQIAAILEQMRATGDVHAFAELDARFHELIATASGNRILQMVFEALDLPIRNLIESKLKSSLRQSRQSTLRHHGAILSAIQGGNAHQAARAARTHLRDFYSSALSPQEKFRIDSLM
ncbi:MAG: FadR family transcriptional regulator [Acidobacteriaceae bacterium]|nr:FadR family transcriptional regulator [Acidobacteriaceae bacterium]